MKLKQLADCGYGGSCPAVYDVLTDACGGSLSSCPGVLNARDGDAVIVGTLIDPSELGEHASRVGEGEAAVKISWKLLCDALAKL